jgi:uncharacterized protein (DUF1684 family)
MNRSRTTLFLIASVLLLAAVWIWGSDAWSEDHNKSESYAQQIEEWKAYRIKRLTNTSGYLSLTACFWIKDGHHSFGSADSNDLMFPGEDVPARMGIIHLDNGVANIEVEPGVEITSDDKLVTQMPMRSDRHEDGATKLKWNELTWWLIQRGDRYAIRLSDPRSPALKHFKGVERYPTNEDWRVVGRLEPYKPAKILEFTDVNGIVSRVPCPGAIIFEWKGKEYRLEGYMEGSMEDYFIIFGDPTNGHETYGGGRFLYVDASDKSGKVVIDFNKAYTPWCAYSDFTTCQLPPIQNRLPIEVTAGEKDYKHKNY